MNKALVIVGPKIGQVVKDGKVVRTDHLIWCLPCMEKKIRNHQRLTKADKKYIDSCEMKEWVVTDRDGVEARGKSCPRCKQTIILEGDYWRGVKKD